MDNGERIELLQQLHDLLLRQQAAILTRDVDAAIACASEFGQLEAKLKRLDRSPSCPRETSLVRSIYRLNRSVSRLLEADQQPLQELAALAEGLNARLCLDVDA